MCINAFRSFLTTEEKIYSLGRKKNGTVNGIVEMGRSKLFCVLEAHNSY